MRDTQENISLASMLFPDVQITVGDILKKYTKRDIKEGELILRIAPSPDRKSVV